jgi:cyclohexanone monooxygenase
MATGNLSTPRKPNIAGLESFKGKWYHTGLWPHEGVDFTGLRVGVIGTGSSGVQSIPIIAKQAKHLYIFQRTANFSLPARNVPMPPDKEQKHKAEYPERRRAAYDTPFGIAGYPPPVKSALEATEDERHRAYGSKMGRRRQHQLSLFVYGFAGEQGGQRHRLGIRPPEDPRHRQGPQDR